MKISVVGVGAVGGVLASNWGQTGVELSLLEREPFISAIREKGLRMIDPEGECVETRPHCVGNAHELPVGQNDHQADQHGEDDRLNWRIDRTRTGCEFWSYPSHGRFPPIRPLWAKRAQRGTSSSLHQR